MDNNFFEHLGQFPVLAVVIFAVVFAVRYVVAYIDAKNKEMNERYDQLNEEYKIEMKESNSKLIELTAKSVSAIENNTQVFKDVMTNQVILEENLQKLLGNQVRIESKIDNLKQ